MISSKRFYLLVSRSVPPTLSFVCIRATYLKPRGPTFARFARVRARWVATAFHLHLIGLLGSFCAPLFSSCSAFWPFPYPLGGVFSATSFSLSDPFSCLFYARTHPSSRWPHSFLGQRNACYRYWPQVLTHLDPITFLAGRIFLFLLFLFRSFAPPFMSGCQEKGNFYTPWGTLNHLRLEASFSP